MPRQVTLNATQYEIPDVGSTYGQGLSDYLYNLASKCATVDGGTRTLLADLNLGATYGLVSAYYKSRNTPATTGILRLGNNELVAWRNAANSADLGLKVNASNILEFNGTPITTLALGAADTVLRMNAGGTAYEYAKIVNANIDASAAIAYSKLALSNSIVNADINSAAAIAYSKLALSNSIVSADINASAAIAYSKLASMSTGQVLLGNAGTPTATTLSGDVTVGATGVTAIGTGVIVNADINASAAIDATKIADGTISNTEFQYLNNVSSNIQTQLNAKLDDVTVATDNALVRFDTNGQALQNSTVIVDDSGNMSGVGTLATSGAVQIAEIATPSTPSSGNVKIYPKSDNKLYILDDLGIESQVGSSTGAGEVNINTNPNADSGYDLNGTNDVGDWIDSGTGTTVSKTTTSSEIPLAPIRTSGIKIVNDGSGTGYTRLRMILPESLENTKLKIQWNQLYSTSTAYASGDFKVEMYSYTDSAFSVAETELALSTDSSGVTNIPALNGRFTTTFDSSTANYLEMRITRVAGSANSFIVLNDVIIGPGIQPQGAVVGGEQSIALTLTNAGNATVVGYVTRRGERAYITGRITIGSSLPTGDIYVNLPSGMTTSILTGRNMLGYANTAVGAAMHTGRAYVASSSAFGFYGDDGLGAWNATIPITFANGNFIDFTADIYINEWAGSGTVNLAQNDVEYASNSAGDGANDTTSFAYGPNGSFVPRAVMGGGRQRRVRFTTPIQATDSFEFEIKNADTGLWHPVGTYVIANNAGNGIVGYMEHGSVSYGAGLAKVINSTDVDFYFGQYRTNAPTYGGAGSDWSSFSGQDVRWRVKKTAAGVATGFAAATATQRGLVKGGEVPGSTSGTAIAAGYVGEKQSVILTTSTTSSATSNTYTDVSGLSVSLTTGTYLVGYSVHFQVAAGTAGNLRLVLGATEVAGSVDYTGSYTGGVVESTVTKIVPIDVSGTQTLKLQLRGTANACAQVFGTSLSGGLADPDNSGNIWFIRIA